ncbi:MAG: DivIVA domain-containing protein [Clostridia bacterium]|nr:DivIVA domain-containing protein [Clostridia bacterium]
MFSPEEIRHITFTQVGRNKYSADEVDDFVDGCADTVERLVREKRVLEQEKAEMAGKLELLANKIVEYRQREESISEALLRAQQAGNTIILEANQKADLIMRDAQIKAENVQEAALRSIKEEEQQLEAIKQTVSDFKATLLDMYRDHLRQIDLLPAEEPEEEPAAESEEETVEVVAEEEAAPVEEAVVEAAPVEEVPAEEEQPEEAPVEEEAVVAVSHVIEPEETEEEIPSRFANLEFGENYEPDEPKKGFFGRKK